MVPFETEVGTLRNYLELQKLRYPDKFNYSLEIDEIIDLKSEESLAQGTKVLLDLPYGSVY